MATKTETKLYELAYHLTPDLEEVNVKIRAQELSDLITQNSGSILSSKEPQRTHLSYPIRKKQYGYLGVFDFTAPAKFIEKIKAQMKLQDDVLRFLLIKRGYGEGDLRILGEHKAERIRTKFQEPAVPKRKTQVPIKPKREVGEEIKTEEIEKEIEEVIKGL